MGRGCSKRNKASPPLYRTVYGVAQTTNARVARKNRAKRKKRKAGVALATCGTLVHVRTVPLFLLWYRSPTSEKMEVERRGIPIPRPDTTMVRKRP